ncbi:MAG: hypothetical protein AB8F74_08895 [Saprospiraceae bacterium]
MSNKASDSLFRLIKSLSKPEKRYFKVFSSRHVIGEKNNYQILFDAIDKQEEYDEEKILKKFKNEAFINRFSIAKSRLYASVLRSLDSYHSNSSLEAQLKRQMHHAEILYNKSLYDQSLKVLKSIKKVALKYEKATTLIEIGKWEKRIMEKDNYEGISKKDLEKAVETDKNLTQKIQIYNNLWHAKSLVFKNLYSKGKIRSKEELKRFKKIIDDLTIKNKEPNMYGENLYLYNHIYSAYYFGVGDYKKSYDFLVDNIKLIEDKPHLFKEEPNIYLSVLTNAIHIASNLGKKEEAFDYLTRLKKMPEKLELDMNEDREMRLFSIVKSAELNLFNEAGEFEKGIALIPEIEEGLVKYDKKLSSVRKAFFYFSIANLHFAQENFNEALKWINQLLNYIDIAETRNIHCMAQLFNLVIHVELDNKSLLPYTLRSTERYLETRHKVYKVETIFLQFVKDLLKKRQDLTEEELFSQLEKEMLPLKEDPFEVRAFEYFDFHQWALSKAQTD